jgi:addiction module HigA family antidote
VIQGQQDPGDQTSRRRDRGLSLKEIHESSLHSRVVHLGETLRMDYQVPLNMSARALAVASIVPGTRIHEIVNERRGISANARGSLRAVFWQRRGFLAELRATYDLKALPTRRRSCVTSNLVPREQVRLLNILPAITVQ